MAGLNGGADRDGRPALVTASSCDSVDALRDTVAVRLGRSESWPPGERRFPTYLFSRLYDSTI